MIWIFGIIFFTFDVVGYMYCRIYKNMQPKWLYMLPYTWILHVLKNKNR